jgi:hypothetical protein
VSPSGDQWKRDSTNPTSNPSEVSGTANPVIRALDIEQPTSIDGMVLSSPSYNLEQNRDGTTSVVIYVFNSDSALLISNNEITAGRGGNGMRGDHSLPGPDGEPGGNGGPWPPHVFDFTNPGLGGLNQCEHGNYDGGMGGAGGIYLDAGDDYPDPEYDIPRQGLFGSPGGSSIHFLAPGGAPANSDWFGSHRGYSGVSALPGTDSTDAGALGIGGDGLGLYSNGVWSPRRGKKGGEGGHGTGGGGGGGGGCGYLLYLSGNWDECKSCDLFEGVGGGGGGGGGCGGYGGDGGGGGGGSIGIILDSSSPIIRNNVIATLGGGGGADGMPGGQGGGGGERGESTITEKNSRGGDGGKGGNGSEGGQGGGGGGGISCGIYMANNSEPFLALNDYSGVGSGGSGGNPNGEDGMQYEVNNAVIEIQETQIPPNETFTDQVDVGTGQQSTELVTFSTTWPGSDIIMSLESPSGRSIGRDTTAPDVTHENGPTFEFYSIVNPEPGNWTVKLFGADVPEVGEAVTLDVTMIADSAPTVAASVEKDHLWPVSHGMVDVGFSFEASAGIESDIPVVTEIKVTSDEATSTADGAGGPFKAPDAEITEDGRILLRAERSELSDGRVYEIKVIATDAFGNHSEVNIPVRVNVEKTVEAINSGQNFDATQVN